MNLALPGADYATLSTRRASSEVKLPRQARDQARHMVIDSIGMKVDGEGEWKVRQRGDRKPRTWRMLDLGVDEASGSAPLT